MFVFCLRGCVGSSAPVLRFLPAFCPEYIRVAPEAEREPRRGEGNSRRLDLPMWLLAWDSYALAGAALDQVGRSLLMFFSLWFRLAGHVRGSHVAQVDCR